MIGKLEEPRNKRRQAANRHWLAMFALLLIAGCGAASREIPSTPPALATLPDGRRLAFRCEGRGSPTVIFEAGFGADSAAWSKVRPELARMTRACAYDRAGYGFSDPGPLPRSAAAIAQDLHDALQGLQIEGPLVVVGHSAGGLYARVFAARQPGGVAGLVLLDGTVEQLAPAPEEDGLGGLRRRLERCLTAAQAEAERGGPVQAPSGCRLPNHIPPKQSVEHWANQLSELNAIFGESSAQVMALGSAIEDIPVYVLTASQTAAAGPQTLTPGPRSLWEVAHQVLASHFRIGFQRTVLSSHLIMIDRPDVVVEAVTAMVQAARHHVPPPPLPPSETAPGPPELEPQTLDYGAADRAAPTILRLDQLGLP